LADNDRDLSSIRSRDFSVWTILKSVI